MLVNKWINHIMVYLNDLKSSKVDLLLHSLLTDHSPKK